MLKKLIRRAVRHWIWPGRSVSREAGDCPLIGPERITNNGDGSDGEVSA